HPSGAPSFPTRRSSDLVLVRLLPLTHATINSALLIVNRFRLGVLLTQLLKNRVQLVIRDKRSLHAGDLTRHFFHERVTITTQLLDRKSTRLNSSHVSTS